jgi:hypothetical protein
MAKLTFSDYMDLAETGKLEKSKIATLLECGAIDDSEHDELIQARKDFAREKRAEKTDASYRDLRGVTSRMGLHGLVTQDRDGKTVVSHGGHNAVLPARSNAELATAFRAIQSMIASVAKAQQENDEKPAELSAVATG